MELRHNGSVRVQNTDRPLCRFTLVLFGYINVNGVYVFWFVAVGDSAEEEKTIYRGVGSRGRRRRKKRRRRRENEQLLLSGWLQRRSALGFTDSKQWRSDARHTFKHLPRETE
uniref:Uncharacterized protein n=1 Tax=Nelumbo nucifera TaxID=4432 RepID=A0A822XW20_NELNU|nr:TPA_asm: hypothetical protein HUJ06_023081 [Nelumbo nucifera]